MHLFQRTKSTIKNPLRNTNQIPASLITTILKGEYSGLRHIVTTYKIIDVHIDNQVSHNVLLPVVDKLKQAKTRDRVQPV